jgi:hypothetical protein
MSRIDYDVEGAVDRSACVHDAALGEPCLEDAVCLLPMTRAGARLRMGGMTDPRRQPAMAADASRPVDVALPVGTPRG